MPKQNPASKQGVLLQKVNFFDEVEFLGSDQCKYAQFFARKPNPGSMQGVPLEKEKQILEIYVVGTSGLGDI